MLIHLKRMLVGVAGMFGISVVLTAAYMVFMFFMSLPGMMLIIFAGAIWCTYNLGALLTEK
jgi:phage shock protein PspC (stress-responsive transcriptional regulator)